MLDCVNPVLDLDKKRRKVPFVLRALSLETIVKQSREYAEYARVYSGSSSTGGTRKDATGFTSCGQMVRYFGYADHGRTNMQFRMRA
ncbi:hypothetical protein PoB_001953800 [Plakobranchus ocellatus]|uniref:Uncharacterized protein n=1 Tax=Plakobranchus ocellatus TaxID=259542 RepID=A0AAV3ZE68_9GAST|nr:hypothetical protein PoB_001953800 [Plakobranchus ocellatus]